MRWNLCSISYAVIVMSLSGNATIAQTPSRPTPKDVVIESNRKELDNLLLRKPILTSEHSAARQAVLKQINEDFKALQLLNNKLMTTISNQDQIDYNFLSKLISEIGSKASRLKSNMVLPKAETDKKKTPVEISNASVFRAELVAFDKVVVSFATNPIFQKPDVLEVELAKQASRDLVSIIEQSARLKKAATRLTKQ
jgi:hypothetical protein